jgi:hypothetical protein
VPDVAVAGQPGVEDERVPVARRFAEENLQET